VGPSIFMKGGEAKAPAMAVTMKKGDLKQTITEWTETVVLF